MEQNFDGKALTPEQTAAGAKFTELVDLRGGLDMLTIEDKEIINELIKKEEGWKVEDLIV